MTHPTVTVLGAGVGTARLLSGMIRILPPESLTVVVNTADDLVLHGLHISPDLDTVTYTLAGEVNPDTGWGLRGETWQAMQTLSRYGGIDWFNLGDRDLGTHLYRTQRLSQGASLSEATAEIARSWGLELTVLPMSDDRVETRVTVAGEGEVGFQDYFVRLRHDVGVTGVRFAGVDSAKPAPGVLEAIDHADFVVVAPSNPVVSIGPVLAVPGIRDAVCGRRESTIAVSPIVGGRALKGPADRLLVELGHEASVRGIARLYRDLASALVIDDLDASSVAAVEAEGMRCVVTDTIMSDPAVAEALCRTVLGSAPR